MPMAERARVWINCATDEGTQHRAKSGWKNLLAQIQCDTNAVMTISGIT